MIPFTRLYLQLDQTNKTGEKVRHLEHYFREAPAEDAAWALFFLIGKRRPRPIKTPRLRVWLAGESGRPDWLVEESYDRIGDLAETISLLVPAPGDGVSVPLHQMVRDHLLPLRDLDEGDQRRHVCALWRRMTRAQCCVWMKLRTGGFRVGVSRTLVSRALARVAGVEPPVMAHRLMGDWTPDAESYRALFASQTAAEPGQPYPFFLASPLNQEPEALGDPARWQVEWKWDGIRAQLIRRHGQTVLWSRGEEVVTDRYPEVADAAGRLPGGTVLDGELLAWRDDAPLPFGRLQRRIGRKSVGRRLLREVPVVFMAYDCLECDATDLRGAPLFTRRQRLEQILGRTDHPALRVSPLVHESAWADYGILREQSRTRRVEGMMIKRRDSPYRTGRPKGDWWKWKIDPFTVDAVLTYAQRGHGRRANLYTDYTFGVWDDNALVTVAKAYSGLSDPEIRDVDRFVRRHTRERFGPVRRVDPELVFELAFEGIRPSARHKSGVALRFPRMARRRTDKRPEEADHLRTLQALAREQEPDDA